MTEEEDFHVLDLKMIKEGQGKVFEFMDFQNMIQRKKMMIKAMRKVLKENPEISEEELENMFSKKIEMFQVEEDNIKDSLKHRKWGIIKKVTDNRGKITIEIERIEQKNYKKHIDILAKEIAKKLNQKNIEDLVRDAIADKNLTPKTLETLAKKKDNVEVQPKRGCFNIVLDKKIIIPIR